MATWDVLFKIYVNWTSILLQCKFKVTYVTFRMDIFAQIRLT